MGVGFLFISSAKLLALSLEKSNPLENLVTAAHSIVKLEGAPISFSNPKESVKNDRGKSSNSHPAAMYLATLTLYLILELVFIFIEKGLEGSHSKKDRLTAMYATFIGGVFLLWPIFCLNPYIGALGTLRTLFVMASFWKTNCKK